MSELDDTLSLLLGVPLTSKLNDDFPIGEDVKTTSPVLSSTIAVLDSGIVVKFKLSSLLVS